MIDAASCTFPAATGETTGDDYTAQCVNGAISGEGKTATFAVLGPTCDWVAWNFLVQCT
jgi:hypothetical protein